MQMTLIALAVSLSTPAFAAGTVGDPTISPIEGVPDESTIPWKLRLAAANGVTEVLLVRPGGDAKRSEDTCKATPAGGALTWTSESCPWLFAVSSDQRVTVRPTAGPLPLADQALSIAVGSLYAGALWTDQLVWLADDPGSTCWAFVGKWEKCTFTKSQATAPKGPQFEGRTGWQLEPGVASLVEQRLVGTVTGPVILRFDLPSQPGAVYQASVGLAPKVPEPPAQGSEPAADWCRAEVASKTLYSAMRELQASIKFSAKKVREEQQPDADTLALVEDAEAWARQRLPRDVARLEAQKKVIGRMNKRPKFPAEIPTELAADYDAMANRHGHFFVCIDHSSPLDTGDEHILWLSDAGLSEASSITTNTPVTAVVLAPEVTNVKIKLTKGEIGFTDGVQEHDSVKPPSASAARADAPALAVTRRSWPAFKSTTIQITVDIAGLSGDTKATSQEHDLLVDPLYWSSVRAGVGAASVYQPTWVPITPNGGTQKVVGVSPVTSLFELDVDIGMSFFFKTMRASEMKNYGGWYVGIGAVTADVEKTKLLQSLSTGPEWGITRHFAIAPVFGVRVGRTPANGYQPGQPVPDGVTEIPTVLTPVVSFGLVLNVSPNVFNLFARSL